MKYQFVQMNKDYAEEIAFTWKYNGVYSFYNMTEDKEDLDEFLDSKNWCNTFAVLDNEGSLSGFYSYIFKDNIMWIGFGLKPDMTGLGFGSNFVIQGINFGVDYHNYNRNYIMLAVAAFNTRAIRTYKKVGFIENEEYIQETNGNKYKFIKMYKEIQ